MAITVWLGNRMKELFNPIADTIASQESNRTKGPLKTMNAGHISEREEVKCWSCSKKHKVATCEDFISSSINVKNKSVKANKLCWNSLGKGHNIKNCQSKHRCNVANCNKRIIIIISITSNHFKLSKTFLQILPVIITNGIKIVHTNALLDAGSDATLIREDIVHILNLRGENKTLEIGNALLNSSSVHSEIVSFIVSSSSHPEKISIDNAFVVPNLNVRYHKIDINKIRSSFPSFKDIELPKLNNTDVIILIGADFPKLHIYKDFKYISDEDPELGWVLLGEKKSSVHVQSNKISTDVKTLDLETFWSIDSYGAVKKLDRILMSKDEKQAYDILEKGICFKNGYYEVGMLWKDPNIHLKNNKVLAVQRLESLEKRSIKNPDKARQYSDTIQKYLKLGLLEA